MSEGNEVRRPRGHDMVEMVETSDWPVGRWTFSEDGIGGSDGSEFENLEKMELEA